MPRPWPCFLACSSRQRNSRAMSARRAVASSSANIAAAVPPDLSAGGAGAPALGSAPGAKFRFTGAAEAHPDWPHHRCPRSPPKLAARLGVGAPAVGSSPGARFWFAAVAADQFLLYRVGRAFQCRRLERRAKQGHAMGLCQLRRLFLGFHSARRLGSFGIAGLPPHGEDICRQPRGD